MIKQSALLLLLVLTVVTADAQYQPVKVSLYTTKQVQYRDQDGDGYGNASFTKSSRRPIDGYVLQRIDGFFDCNDSSAALNPGAPEICNFIDDNCNGVVDDEIQHYYYYSDANGDGYGDDTAVTALCSSSAPTGYTAVAPVLPDFTLTTTGHVLNPLIWGASLENFIVNDQGILQDLLNDPIYSNLSSLKFNVYSYSGTPQGHYTIYPDNDTLADHPIGKGGFNPIVTSNKSVYYGKQFSKSFFPYAVELAARLSAKLIIQTPPVIDHDGWLSCISYANRRTGVAGILMYQEFNGNYVDCPMCANGSRVKDSANKIINITMPVLPGIYFTTDVGYSYNNSYSQSNFQITGFTDSRLYYSESRSTSVRSAATVQQMKDSMDLSLRRFESKANELVEANGGHGIAVTSWYSDGADPFGGKYVSDRTWLQAYYECSLVSIAFVNYDVEYPGKLHYALYGRLDRLNASGNMNLKGKAFTVIAPAVTSGLTMQTVNLPAGIGGNAWAGADHHGYIIVINPTANTLHAKYVSDNGYITTVKKIQVLKATSLTDSNPVLGEEEAVTAYTIARIEF